MNPSTKEEFVELSQLIVGKLSNYEVTVIHCEIILIPTLRDLCFIRLPNTKKIVENMTRSRVFLTKFEVFE